MVKIMKPFWENRDAPRVTCQHAPSISHGLGHVCLRPGTHRGYVCGVQERQRCVSQERFTRRHVFDNLSPAMAVCCCCCAPSHSTLSGLYIPSVPLVVSVQNHLSCFGNYSFHCKSLVYGCLVLYVACWGQQIMLVLFGASLADVRILDLLSVTAQALLGGIRGGSDGVSGRASC